MRLKKIVLSISKHDIMNFLQLQNKINVDNITIDNVVDAIGTLQFLNMKINFETKLSPIRVENNNLYVHVDSFKILKMNILNQLSKKVFNYVLSALTDFEGISFEGNDLKIEIPKLIKKYFKEQTIIDIDKVTVTDVAIVNDEIEVTFGGININTDVVTEELNMPEPPVVEAEIVNGGVDDINFSLEEIKKYEKDFSEDSFFDKLKKYGKTAGVSVVYSALLLFYTYKNKNVPLSAKAISMGALGYFILPTDFIPDILLAVGYSDDLIALITALKSITPYINDEIKYKAKNKVVEWFGEIDEKELEVINTYI